MRIDKRNNDLKKILKIVSVELNIPVAVCEEVFSQYYKEVHNIINDLNKDDILDYPVLKIPMFGKLYISELKKKKIKTMLEDGKRND